MYDAPIAIIYVCVNNFRKHIWPRCRKFLIQMILMCHSPFCVLVSLRCYTRKWWHPSEGVAEKIIRWGSEEEIPENSSCHCTGVQQGPSGSRQIFLNSDYVLVNSLRRVTMGDFFLWVILEKNQQFRNEWPVNIFFAGNKKGAFLKS